jgi:hypothetical protein
MVRRWSQDPQYTHGYVVPLFAAVVLWFRRDRFPAALRSSWWDIGLLLFTAVSRLVSEPLAKTACFMEEERPLLEIPDVAP